MLAIGVMSATATAIFYTVAVVLFVLGGIGYKLPNDRIHLMALGLAAFVFVFAWNAWAGT